MDLALNILQRLICHNTQTNKPKEWAQAHLKMLSIKYVYKLCLIYMYKWDLPVNNLQGLICHKIKPYNCANYYYKYTLLAQFRICWLYPAAKGKPLSSKKKRFALSRTLNCNILVNLQSWRSGKCGVTPQCHYSSGLLQGGSTR